LGYGYIRRRPATEAASKLPAVILFLAVGLFIAADLLFEFDFNWVDYAIVIIIALFGLKGYMRGLANTVFSLVGYILSIVCAYVFSAKLALLAMQKTGLGRAVGRRIESLLPVVTQIPAINTGESQTSLEFLENNPQINEAISSSPFLKQLLAITHSAADTQHLYRDTVVTMGDMLTFTIMKVLAIIVLFVGVKVVAVLIGKFLTSILNFSTIMGTANRTGGMVLGMGAGLIVVYVIFALFIPFLGSLNFIHSSGPFTGSVVMQWLNSVIMSLGGS